MREQREPSRFVTDRPGTGPFLHAKITQQELGKTFIQAQADRLTKLASLLDQGLLTRAEFDELKAKLITGL